MATTQPLSCTNRASTFYSLNAKAGCGGWHQGLRITITGFKYIFLKEQFPTQFAFGWRLWLGGCSPGFGTLCNLIQTISHTNATIFRHSAFAIGELLPHGFWFIFIFLCPILAVFELGILWTSALSQFTLYQLASSPRMPLCCAQTSCGLVRLFPVGIAKWWSCEENFA